LSSVKLKYRDSKSLKVKEKELKKEQKQDGFFKHKLRRNTSQNKKMKINFNTTNESLVPKNSKNEICFSI